MCANEFVYLRKSCAQMNHILSNMCSNMLPPFSSYQYLIKFFPSAFLEWHFRVTASVPDPFQDLITTIIQEQHSHSNPVLFKKS